MVSITEQFVTEVPPFYLNAAPRLELDQDEQIAGQLAAWIANSF